MRYCISGQVPSEDSDQPVHLGTDQPSLGPLWIDKDLMFVKVDSEHRSDCMDAQADLRLCLEDVFTSQAHICVIIF